MIMKYLHSANHWYTTELGMLYKKERKKEKAFKLGQCR